MGILTIFVMHPSVNIIYTESKKCRFSMVNGVSPIITAF